MPDWSRRDRQRRQEPGRGGWVEHDGFAAQQGGQDDPADGGDQREPEEDEQGAADLQNFSNNKL